MKILALGGTQFVGRHIVEELLRGGHAVSLLNRGVTRDELPGELERLRGDRDEGHAGLSSLAGHAWDACIDVSGLTARQVRASAELLRKNVGRYVYISAISVYGDPGHGPVDESQPRVPPAEENVTEINAETYGPLKVTCENIVQELFDDRCALLRPQIVAGPYDPVDRFSYWVRRAAQGGAMLAPGDGSDYLQTVDAGDLARFTRRVCEAGLAGSFNLAGPRLTWTDFMQILGAKNLVWVPNDIIASSRVTEFELPLYRSAGGRRSSLMHVSNDRAVAAGLTISDPRTTIANVRAWLCSCELAPALSPEREAALIQASRGRVV
jgi:nucleoside-diphosphate-sugar epimerase